TSAAFTPTTAGTYRWIANYSGDANNTATANACNAANESVVVNLANPAVTTQASAPITVGSGSISDTATLAGGVSPTGSIVFRLYGPNDATCTGTAISSSTAMVSGNGNYSSAPFTPTAAGTYRWIANYSGDTNNNPTANACNEANENVVVSPRTPTLSSTQRVLPNDSAALGNLTTDATGTLTFQLFTTTDCSGTAVFEQEFTVDGSGTFSTTNSTVFVTDDNDGTWKWTVVYSGDTNNAGATKACGAEQFTIDIVD
ncbi:MAG: hypothetical protein WKF80_12115, partial [Thermomicrobiales bacterium]